MRVKFIQKIELKGRERQFLELSFQQVDPVMLELYTFQFCESVRYLFVEVVLNLCVCKRDLPNTLIFPVTA